MLLVRPLKGWASLSSPKSPFYIVSTELAVSVEPPCRIRASKVLGYSLSSLSSRAAFCIRKQFALLFTAFQPQWIKDCHIQVKILQEYPPSPVSFFSFYPTGQAHPKCWNCLEVNAVSQDPLGLLATLQRVSVRARTDVCSLSNMQNFSSSFIKLVKSRICKNLGKWFHLPKILNLKTKNAWSFKSFNYQLIKEKYQRNSIFSLPLLKVNKVNIKMLWALHLNTTCFPVTAFSLLPAVSLPSSSKCSYCHCSPCQMLEWDSSYKKS